jgi:hypothetical protein
MERKEQEFFEWFDKIQAIADENDVTFYQVVNARQIWDYAYLAGKSEGLEFGVSVIQGGK